MIATAYMSYALEVQRRLLLFTVAALLAQCSSTPPTAPPGPLPGEQACDPQSILAYLVTFDPPSTVVAAGSSRPVTLVLNPDVCNASSVTFTSDNPSLVAPPQTAQVDLRHASYDFTVQPTGDAATTTGIATITATMLDPGGLPHKNQDGTTAMGTIKIDVRPKGEPACKDTSTVALSQAQPSQNGSGTLANASLGSTAGAFTRTDWLGLPSFGASLACASDITTSDLVALTPAVSFTPTSALSEITPLRREIDFAIPINPANFPSAARIRHLEVMFSNKKARTPRPVTVANPRIEQAPDGNYALKFQSPWFGTYQAFARFDAGTRTHSRHLTHRAVIGISMGGGGAATFGMHHHDEFDAIGPMGGPSDWTWLSWFVEQYALGGFCPSSNPTCTVPAPSAYPATDTYMHTEDFNHWWSEAGSGNGGHFPRGDYEQIFTDLALQRGNPNGNNTDLPYFAAGPKKTDPWVNGDTTGLPAGTDCSFTLSPISTLPDGGADPFYPSEQAIQSQCAKTRCDPSHTYIVPNGYYDDEYNPNGTEQVISICDGNQVGGLAAIISSTGTYNTGFAGGETLVLGFDPKAPPDSTFTDFTVTFQAADQTEAQVIARINQAAGFTFAVQGLGSTMVLTGPQQAHVVSGSANVLTALGLTVTSAGPDSTSPYENTFLPPSPDQAYPMSLALAVDLNKNGVRDENEPVIRNGHEPWQDTGTDGLADSAEPGYDAVSNPDPNGDDYDPYINPTGTENDHRYEVGETFQDYGLDGVANTKSSPFDAGEGDGVFTMSEGLKNFYAIDPHAILRGWSTNTTMADSDLQRFSIWSDGGVRDLFNFAAVATHFTGAISSRRTSDGHPVQSVAFYNGFNMLPGEDQSSPDNFVPALIRWNDVANSASLRYGTVDATPTQISQGDGQHVGTGAQILYRLEAAFYYVAHQWPDADRLLTNTSGDPTDGSETTTPNVLGTACEILGHCETTFTGPKSGRTGPIAVTLPPGYGNAANQKRNVRYPVVFVLHGYGQKPEDLEALQLISNNFMNDGTRSYEARLAKFIAVYVDGRCREGSAPTNSQAGTPQGQPECIQGGFYLDSTRPGGALFDTWFDELVQYVDQNYRTMPPSDVTVTE